MVKQFRPPLGCYTLEFPAGLIDKGETAEVAALRELKEETGYKGEVVGVTPVTCLDPGLSNCTTQTVLVNINGDDMENIHPTQQLEFVDVILLPLDEFQTKIDDLLKKEKIMVDAKVYVFAMGMVQAFFKPRELPVLKQFFHKAVYLKQVATCYFQLFMSLISRCSDSVFSNCSFLI
ncbi:ADP-sugar pyrophosphatase isoform X3 [Betta splendens]|nr:ADP-sugar pyrophosphatase isoform X3 [Betta splendens]